jgi:photosystem II stability/assembly factor-like uncharacterized protein
MKKQILLYLLCFVSLGYSQTAFQYQLTFPQGNNVNNVNVISDNSYAGVGNFGTFIRTNDGGSTWLVKHFVNTLNTSFMSVIFSSSTDGFICSSNGHILKTVNSGNNWVAQISGVSTPLNAIYFTNGSNGYAVGVSGVILRTTNSGSNWIKITTDTSVVLNTVFFSSQNTGYIGSSNGILLKTTNAGVNWSSAYENHSLIKKLFFVSDLTGFLCGNSVIKKTVNGGTVWDSIAPYNCNSVFFINSNTGYFTSSYYKVYKTTNGGNTFTSLTLNSGYDNLYSIAVNTNGFGITSGPNGYLFKTTNFGENWNAIHKSHSEYLSYLKFDSENNGIVVDRMGSVLKTYDGGNNYIQKSQPGSYILTGFYFSDTSDGYGVGASGRIMKTVNGGTNWTQLTTGITTSLSKIHFNSGLGLAVGYYGIILRTNNQGNNWTSQTSTTNNWLKGVYIYSSSSAFVCGENQILKSTDDGMTWQSKTVGMSLDMQCIHTPNGGNVWAGGDKIYYSSNSGDNWSMQFNPEKPINAMKFINTSVGYAVGTFGYAIKTTNGGQNWTKLNIPYGSDLIALDFINENIGWISGNGTILKTSTGGSVFIQFLSTEMPSGYSLEQNYPNPFNPITNIKFNISKSDFVSLKVYDLLGKEISSLVNESLKPGTYQVQFDAKNLSSGIYFYCLKTKSFTETKRMILLK